MQPAVDQRRIDLPSRSVEDARLERCKAPVRGEVSVDVACVKAERRLSNRLEVAVRTILPGEEDHRARRHAEARNDGIEPA